jgi:hypothetical protein
VKPRLVRVRLRAIAPTDSAAGSASWAEVRTFATSAVSLGQLSIEAPGLAACPDAF